MKNNKGFTLIELMAVIIILAVIGLIIFPSAIESINNSKDKLYKEQVKRILDAADSWASSNDSKLPSNTNDSKPIKITIENLQLDGLLKKEDVKNPLNSADPMSPYIVIYYDYDYKQYVSGYCDVEYSDKYYKPNEWSEVKGKCDIAEDISEELKSA